MSASARSPLPICHPHSTPARSIMFLLDPETGLPPYRQITQQVKRALRLGRLLPGDRLPTAVTVAATIGVSINTVHRAYRDLQSQGVVESHSRGGTYVRSQPFSASTSATQHAVESLEAWVAEARADGLDAATIADLLDSTAFGLSALSHDHATG
jgi:GntR family transcriptional regulator